MHYFFFNPVLSAIELNILFYMVCSICSFILYLNAAPLNFQVHFPDEENLVEVHPVSEMIEWCDAYQECRKGPWEQFALDRERFKNRIKDSEAILAPILLHCHRHKIYSERFDEN